MTIIFEVVVGDQDVAKEVSRRVEERKSEVPRIYQASSLKGEAADRGCGCADRVGSGRLMRTIIVNRQVGDCNRAGFADQSEHVGFSVGAGFTANDSGGFACAPEDGVIGQHDGGGVCQTGPGRKLKLFVASRGGVDGGLDCRSVVGSAVALWLR